MNYELEIIMAKKPKPFTLRFRLIKSIVFRIGLTALFFTIVFCVIAYARGYRPNFQTRSLESTGIIATSSSPKAAKVYVNGILKGVTDLNLTLPPGEYTVEMKKEGYTDWSKKVILKGEIVISLDGLLFPKNPSLSPITSLGVSRAIPVDQTDRMILVADNADLEKDGVYSFSLGNRPLSLLPPLKPLILKKNLPPAVSINSLTITYSPDYQEGIFEFTSEQGTVSYLLSLDEENTQPFDITSSKETLIAAWKEEKNREIRKILETFPKPISKIASDSFRLVAFSPDETKVLYQATKTTVLPPIITPPLIGANQTKEERTLKQNALYVYDRKEDKNFEVTNIQLPSMTPMPVPRTLSLTPTPQPLLYMDESLLYTITWYADSKHFVINEKRQIFVIDYDGANKRTIYSGPFEEDFFTVTREGKLLILTNLNPQHNTSSDLYEVGIR